MKSLLLITLLACTSCVGERYLCQDPNWERITSYPHEKEQFKTQIKELKDSIRAIRKTSFERANLNDLDMWNLFKYQHFNKKTRCSKN